MTEAKNPRRAMDITMVLALFEEPGPGDQSALDVRRATDAIMSAAANVYIMAWADQKTPDARAALRDFFRHRLGVLHTLINSAAPDLAAEAMAVRFRNPLAKEEEEP